MNFCALTPEQYIRDATSPREGRKAPSVHAARCICETVAGFLERGEPLPAPLRAYMVKALKKIADGDDANVCLHVKGSAGVSVDPEDLADRDYEIFQRTDELIDNGLRKTRAYAKVADNLNASNASQTGRWWTPQDVGKIYRKWRAAREEHDRACWDEI